MSRNAGGTYTRVTPPGPGGYVGGVGNPIYASQVNGEINDIRDEITDSLSRSGKGAMLAALNMGGFAITNSPSVFASGTRLAFFQAAAPTGWTQVTAEFPTDSMLRVVTTAGGGYAGTHSAILNDKIPVHTHTAGSGGASSDHTHTISPQASYTSAQAASGSGVTGLFSAAGGTLTGGMNSDHTHAITVNNNSGASAVNWTPKYVDMIICNKT